MKYCVYYQKANSFKPIFNEIDEVEIKYNKKDLTLPKFLEKHLHQTVIISLTKEEDIDSIPLLKELYENYKSFKLKIDYRNEKMLKAVMDSKIPYFFSNFIDNWSVLTGVLAFNPTDIYIVNELGFELDKVANIVHKRHIAVRVFANIAQSSWEDTSSGLKKFFIRPEDVKLYEPYVDVIEFFEGNEKVPVLYEIYRDQKHWYGKLNEIISELNSDIDNRCVLPNFAKRRIKCEKKCIKGGKCKLCDRMEDLANTMKEQNLIIRVDKTK